MTKQTDFKEQLRLILAKHGAEEALEEIIISLKALQTPIEPDNPVYQKLRKWLVGNKYESTQLVKVNRLWKKYGEVMCKKVLKDSACKSEYSFIQIAEYHRKKT